MENVMLRLPFTGDFPVSLGFGKLPDDPGIQTKFSQWGIVGHHGLDFALPVGTPVLASAAGEVTQAGDNGDWGISVTLKHVWGESIYAHLSQISVTVGQSVDQGAVIGTSGESGAAFGPHLHLGIRPMPFDPGNGFLGYIDPVPYFSTTIPEVSTQPSTESGHPAIHELRDAPDGASLRARANEIRKRRKEERRQKIIEFSRGAQVTNGYLQQSLRVSRQTITNDLRALVSSGLLTRTGRGRHATYTAAVL